MPKREPEEGKQVGWSVRLGRELEGGNGCHLIEAVHHDPRNSLQTCAAGKQSRDVCRHVLPQPFDERHGITSHPVLLL